jgi:NADH:ubiquinone oxidoreductase subunit 4 (subunit M)
MNAPLLWIFLPLAIGGTAMFLPGQRIKVWVGGMTALILCAVALAIPIDSALLIGPLSIKISSSAQILGRSLVLGAPDGQLLAILYGLAAMWFFGAEAVGVANRLIPLGLAVIALLVASIAVEPFLFAAVFIEIAVLLVVPMLAAHGQPAGRGVVRFLIYQTLAMPFILYAGWLLAGVESSPSDLDLTVQSATMLGLGFAFLLAVFPLYSWIPLLGEEGAPFTIGFLFWTLPTITIVFGIGFLDRFAWLRSSTVLTNAVSLAGVLMVVTGGWWSAFQRHLGRMMAYAAIAETGFVMMALSVSGPASVEVIFLQLIPRGFGLAVWSFALSILKQRLGSLDLPAVQGCARAYPVAAAGVVLAHLSVAGFPLLAGFPARLALWEGLAQGSLTLAFWLLIGLLGLLVSGLRTLAVLVMAPEQTAWELQETRLQALLLGIGLAGLFLFGLFPQLLRPFLADLPLMFSHLG